MYGNEIRGLTEFFSGAMAGVKTQPITCIKVIVAATFTHLTMKHRPGTNSTGATNDPTTVIFPAGYELWGVESFQLASGSIQVYYKATNT